MKPTTTEKTLTGRMSDSDIYLAVIGFLTTSWYSRKHDGLVHSDGTPYTLNDIKRETLRFIESLKAPDGKYDSGKDRQERVHMDPVS